MIFLLHQRRERFFVHRRYYRVVWRLLNYQRPVQMATLFLACDSYLHERWQFPTAEPADGWQG